MMRQRARLSFTVIMPILLSSFLCAKVAPIVPGESLWWIVRRIGLAVDDIESKVDRIDLSAAGAYGIIALGQSNVSGGFLAISTSGSYCLKENITAQITIGASDVLLDMNGRRVTGTIQVLSGSCLVIKNGFVIPLAPTSSSDPAGIEVAVNVSQLFIDRVTVVCADATAGGGVDGRDAMLIRGNDIQIKECTLIAGAGGSAAIGSGGAGGHGITVMGATDLFIEACTVLRAGNGGAGFGLADGGGGGHGIALSTTAAGNICIKNCTIQKSGVGGNGVATGGAGGHGISIASIGNTKVVVNACVISDTGIGGNGGTSGGAGGSGVFIGSSNTDVSVHHCTISNTGVAGVGGTSQAGKAIFDAVPAGAGSSKVYANVAYDITNAITYDLQATGIEHGFALSNPPTSTAVSMYANVFM